MILPDHLIVEAVRSGRVGIDPYEPGRVQPASYDLRLGDRFRRFPDPPPGLVDPWDPPAHPEGQLLSAPDGLVLEPFGFVLGHTVERVRLPADLSARVEGRSTLGRLGLCVHATAGYVDTGFDGQITLELSNQGPFRLLLRPGRAVCQLSLVAMDGPSDRPYGTAGVGRYQNQAGPTAARPRLSR